MSIQRLFSLFLFCISVAGIFSSLSLDLIVTNNVGPGFFPLVYSVLLAVCSVVLFFQNNSNKLRLSSLFQKPFSDSVFFYLMLIACFLAAKYLGLMTSLGIFSVTVLLQQKRLTLRQIILFEVLLMLFLYLLFVAFLNVPFEHGVLFQ